MVPVELILGRSDSTSVMLTGVRAFPTGLGMRLGVRVRGRVYRRDLNGEVFDGPYTHDMDADWQAGRLKWGLEFADGRRITNVDPWPRHSDELDAEWEPDRPVLIGEGGGGSDDPWTETTGCGHCHPQACCASRANGSNRASRCRPRTWRLIPFLKPPPVPSQSGRGT